MYSHGSGIAIFRQCSSSRSIHQQPTRTRTIRQFDVALVSRAHGVSANSSWGICSLSEARSRLSCLTRRIQSDVRMTLGSRSCPRERTQRSPLGVRTHSQDIVIAKCSPSWDRSCASALPARVDRDIRFMFAPQRLFNLLPYNNACCWQPNWGRRAPRALVGVGCSRSCSLASSTRICFRNPWPPLRNVSVS